MYLAELHGKLSSRLEDAEDILTSNVFSFLKYSNRAIFLRRYLRMLGFNIPVADVFRSEFIFWPRLDENTEPDVIIRVGGHYILFEAKFHSGFADGNATTKAQLVREIEGGMLEANNYGERFFLVALTADYCHKPHRFSCIPPEHKPSFRWTNWQKLTGLIQQVLEGDNSLTVSEREFAEDLYDLLCRKHLREYGGIWAFENIPCKLVNLQTIFLNAASVGFRGHFIGFSTSLVDEVGLVTPPASIFWYGKTVSHCGRAYRPADANGTSNYLRERRLGLFTDSDVTDALTHSEPSVFFRRKCNGE
jgi:hypothetical protein